MHITDVTSIVKQYSYFKGCTIYFVDRGNISRSTVADVFCTREINRRRLGDLYICAAGGTQGLFDPKDPHPVAHPNLTHYPQYSLAKDWLRANKIDLSSQMSDTIQKYFAEKAAIIFAMDQRTVEAMTRIFPYYADKVHLFSEIKGEKRDFIDTEYVTSKDAAIAIYEDIKDTISNHFDNMIKLTLEQDRRTIEGHHTSFNKER